MPMPSIDARRNLLPNERLESFWDGLWLGIGPFLYKYRDPADLCIMGGYGSIRRCTRVPEDTKLTAPTLEN